MKELNLYRLWEVCNVLSNKLSELSEQNIFISLLGHRSNYNKINFKNFLKYYNFKIEDDVIIVFNDDGIPYEPYNNDDFSYIPSVLLSFYEKDLEKWIDDEIEAQLKQQKLEKLQRKDYIKSQIKNLETQLNNL